MAENVLYHWTTEYVRGRVEALDDIGLSSDEYSKARDTLAWALLMAIADGRTIDSPEDLCKELVAPDLGDDQ